MLVGRRGLGCWEKKEDDEDGGADFVGRTAPLDDVTHHDILYVEPALGPDSSVWSM